MQGRQRACIIENKNHHDRDLGNLTVFDVESFPWLPQRVFMVYGTPHCTVRGRHAHKATEMIMVATMGPIMVRCRYTKRDEETHWLHNPSKSLYVPPMVWCEVTYSEGTSLAVFCNTPYDRSDYIEDFHDYLRALDGNDQKV
jgi:hypothetical protein